MKKTNLVAFILFIVFAFLGGKTILLPLRHDWPHKPSVNESLSDEKEASRFLLSIVAHVRANNLAKVKYSFSAASDKESSRGNQQGTVNTEVFEINITSKEKLAEGRFSFAIMAKLNENETIEDNVEVSKISDRWQITSAPKLGMILLSYIENKRIARGLSSLKKGTSASLSSVDQQTINSLIYSNRAIIREKVLFTDQRENIWTLNKSVMQSTIQKDLFASPVGAEVVVPSPYNDYMAFVVDNSWDRIVYGSLNGNWIKAFTGQSDLTLQSPRAIDVDWQGNIFGINGNGQIFRLIYNSTTYNINYVLRFVVPNSVSPSDVQIGGSNTLYISDVLANKIFETDFNGSVRGTYSKVIDDGTGTEYTFYQPSKILFTSLGSTTTALSIIDTYKRRLITITGVYASGDILHGSEVFCTVFDQSTNVELSGLGMDSNGELFATDSKNGLLHTFVLDDISNEDNGTSHYICSIKSDASGQAQWQHPVSIASTMTTSGGAYQSYDYDFLTYDQWTDQTGANFYLPGADYFETNTQDVSSNGVFRLKVLGKLTNKSKIDIWLYSPSGALRKTYTDQEKYISGLDAVYPGNYSFIVSGTDLPANEKVGLYKAVVGVKPYGNDSYDASTKLPSDNATNVFFALPLAGGMSGSTSGTANSNVSWTATATSGSGDFTFTWYRRDFGSNTWTFLASGPHNYQDPYSYHESLTMGNKSFTIRCDVTDNFNGNTQTDTQYVSSITTSGSLSSNETWPSNVTLTGTVTVPSGYSLVLLNTTVQFPGEASLIANGNLYAEGATFTSTGSTSPGAWGSIQFNGSGANGSALYWATVSYGTEIDLNQTSNVTIEGCTISGNSGNGIYLYFSSDCTMYWNTIANSNIYHGIRMDGGSGNNCYVNTIYKTNQNHQGAGIMYSGCGGNIWQNDIRYYNWGVGAIWGASPDFMSYDNWGMNNRITDCSYGVMVYQQSYPIIGPEPGYDIEHYAGNSIYNNAKEVALNTSYSTVSNLWANGVWWGSDPPNRSLFQIGSGSYISGLISGDGYYGEEYYLESDPWSGIPLPRAAENGNGALVAQPKEQRGGVNKKNGITPKKNSAVNTSVYTPKGTLYDGIQLRLQHKYKEAKDFFIDYLKKNPKDQAAYVELYNCYPPQNGEVSDSKETATDITNYFESLPSSAAKEQKLLLANLYLMSQRDGLVQDGIAKAKKVNDDLVSGNKNTALAEKAKLNKFYIALYNENDPESAATILSDALSAPSLSTEMELSDAQAALTNYINPKTGEKPGARLLAKMSEPLPTTYGIDQNFPNPFNPSTVINYQLPENSHVLLKVYDVLGRDVQTLVNEDKPAGRYSVEFNASKLSSGMYFYAIRAGNYAAVKKMLMVK